jgi:uncharacterized MAPEG superfamily protein
MEKNETERQLRAELDGTRERLLQTQRELFDCRARLALIARICEDSGRALRTPAVAFGAVRAAVYSTSANVRLLDEKLPERLAAG